MKVDENGTNSSCDWIQMSQNTPCTSMRPQNKAMHVTKASGQHRTWVRAKDSVNAHFKNKGGWERDEFELWLNSNEPKHTIYQHKTIKQSDAQYEGEREWAVTAGTECEVRSLGWNENFAENTKFWQRKQLEKDSNNTLRSQLIGHETMRYLSKRRQRAICCARKRASKFKFCLKHSKRKPPRASNRLADDDERTFLFWCPHANSINKMQFITALALLKRPESTPKCDFQCFVLAWCRGRWEFNLQGAR